jgi:hypothetical protein
MRAHIFAASLSVLPLILGPEAIFDPVFAHPDMLFGNAACGGPRRAHLGRAHPRHSETELTNPALTNPAVAPPAVTKPAVTNPEVPATTERASLISVTAEAIAILGTVP